MPSKQSLLGSRDSVGEANADALAMENFDLSLPQILGHRRPAAVVGVTNARDASANPSYYGTNQIGDDHARS